VSVLLCHYLPVYVLLPCCLLVSLDVLLFHCLLCFCPTIHMSPSFYPTVPYLIVSVLLCHYLPVYVLLPCCLLVSLDVQLLHCLLCFCPTIHMSPSFYPTVPYLLVSVLLCHYLPVTKKKHTLCRRPSDEHSSKVRLVNQLQRRFKCDKFTDKVGDKDGPRKVMTISHMITPSGKLNIHETTEHSLLNR
jgi:hypothetical protein